MPFNVYTHTHTHTRTKVARRLWYCSGSCLILPSSIYNYFLCREIVVCVCMYGGRYIHTYVVLYINTNGMHILKKLPLVLLFFTAFILESLVVWGLGLVWGQGSESWCFFHFSLCGPESQGSESWCFFHSPLCGSWSHAMLVHTLRCVSLWVNTIPSTQPHRHAHTRM